MERMILFGEGSLRKAIHEFIEHYHHERNHQGLGNRLIVEQDPRADKTGAIQCRQRLLIYPAAKSPNIGYLLYTSTCGELCKNQRQSQTLAQKHKVPLMLRENAEKGELALACPYCDVEAHGGRDKELRIVADAMKRTTR